jgi:hypothetical protein
LVRASLWILIGTQMPLVAPTPWFATDVPVVAVLVGLVKLETKLAETKTDLTAGLLAFRPPSWWGSC